MQVHIGHMGAMQPGAGGRAFTPAQRDVLDQLYRESGNGPNMSIYRDGAISPEEAMKMQKTIAEARSREEQILLNRSNRCLPLTDYSRAPQVRTLEAIGGTMSAAVIMPWSEYKARNPAGQPMMECFDKTGKSVAVREMTSAEKKIYVVGDTIVMPESTDQPANGEGLNFSFDLGSDWILLAGAAVLLVLLMRKTQ